MVGRGYLGQRSKCESTGRRIHYRRGEIRISIKSDSIIDMVCNAPQLFASLDGFVAAVPKVNHASPIPAAYQGVDSTYQRIWLTELDELGNRQVVKRGLFRISHEPPADLPLSSPTRIRRTGAGLAIRLPKRPE